MARKTLPPIATAVPLNGTQRTAFRSALLRWFDHHQRKLPWRQNREPYRVWLSEIMLQQTRVAAVLEHYTRFLTRFPDVRSLAAASTSSVLAAWSGLGYYRRARMLHAAARQIAHELDGRFPETAEAWRELPGIGRYTAAAIASICYDEPSAVVDGNVERVLARMIGATPQNVWEAASELLSRRRPGDFNQAMMELGATICLPKAPECADCPVTRFCQLRRNGTTAPAQPAPRREKRELSYALITDADRVMLTRRSQRESVMPGMWELPAHNSAQKPDFTVRHSIMNTDYLVHVARLDAATASMPGAKRFTASQLAKLPLTGLARKILQRSGII
jgi:A/G-specific adenine glycosylase